MDKELKKLIIYGACILTGIAIIVLAIIKFDVTLSIVNNLISIILPIILGAIIAFIVNPLYKKIYNIEKKIFKKEKDKILKYTAIAIAEIIFISLTIILILFVFPSLGDSINNIVNSLPSAIQETKTGIIKIIEENVWIKETFDISTDTLFNNIQDKIMEFATQNIEVVSKYAIKTIGDILGFVTTLLIAIVINIMLLASKERIINYSKKIVLAIFNPKASKLIIEEAVLANNVLNGFFIGKIVDSSIIGAITFIVALIMQLEYPLLISLIIGITNIIPFFGPFIGAIPASIIVFSKSPLLALYFVIYLLIIQQIDGNIIGPKCIGNSTKIDSLGILVAILICGNIWGVPGMIFGVPLFAILGDIINKIIDSRLKSRNIEVEQITGGKDN